MVCRLQMLSIVCVTTNVEVSWRRKLLTVSNCHQLSNTCRFGGYLGVKYVLAARPDLAPSLLPMTLPLLKQGLEVRGVQCCQTSRCQRNAVQMIF